MLWLPALPPASLPAPGQPAFLLACLPACPSLFVSACVLAAYVAPAVKPSSTTSPYDRACLQCSPSLRAVGRRNFADFLSQYIAPLPGRFVDVETGADLGPCPDIAAVTHGQRPGIGGAAQRVYAVGKDVVGASTNGTTRATQDWLGQSSGHVMLLRVVVATQLSRQGSLFPARSRQGRPAPP